MFNLPAFKTIDLGGFGVTIFFALSGFLISYLLLKEGKKNKKINVFNFYFRRVLRIWPLYFLYLLIGLIALILTNHAIDLNFLYYIFVSANIPFILGIGLPHITHLWSIGVEEQFYLFWPWLFKLNTKPRKLVVGFVIFFVLLRLIFRLIEIKFALSTPYLAIHVIRFDCMGIGAIGAILLFEDRHHILNIIKIPFIQIISWLPIFLLAINKFHIASVFDHELISVFTTIIIINVSTNPKTIINLENKLMNFLGRISYGIYVIHPIVLLLWSIILNSFDMQEEFKIALVYSGTIIITICLAWLSYNYYEKPFLLIKEK
jgi:peptidoglycan/LPS O-acetylase OafA/YrhL